MNLVNTRAVFDRVFPEHRGHVMHLLAMTGTAIKMQCVDCNVLLHIDGLEAAMHSYVLDADRQREISQLLYEEANKFSDVGGKSLLADADLFEALRSIEVFSHSTAIVVRFSWRVPRKELYRGDDPKAARRVRDLARGVVRDSLKLARMEGSTLRGKKQRKLQNMIMEALGAVDVTAAE